MPIIANFMASQINLAGKSAGLKGDTLSLLAQAVAEGLTNAMMAPGMLAASLTGVSGVGIVSSLSPPVGVLPPPMSTSIGNALRGAGMGGPSVNQLAFAVATGFCACLPTMLATGSCPTVSTGGGVAKLVGLQPPTLHSLLMTAAIKNNMKGTEVTKFMMGLSNGVCTYLTASFTIPVAAVGPPVPPPIVGPFPSVGSAVMQLI